MKKIIFFMLPALAFLLVCCRQLDAVQEKESQNLKPQVSLIRNNNILKNPTVLKEIAKIQAGTFQNLKSSKNIQDSLLEGAVISTENVILVESNGRKTYTFPVERSFKNSKIENLVLKQNPDSTFSGVLIQYDITEKEKELFISGHDIDMKNKMKVFEISKLNLSNKIVTEAYGCFVITWETGMCSAGVHSSGHDAGCTVGGAPSPVLISVVNTCSGGAGPSSDPLPPYPNGGNTSGGNTGYDTLPYSDSSDQMFALYQSFFKAFKLNTYSLDSDLRFQLFYLYLNGGQDSFTVTAILQALTSAGNTQQNQAVLRQIIQELNMNEQYRNNLYQLNSNRKKEIFVFATSFLKNNPEITWAQFNDWFLVEAIHENLQGELFEDWADVNRVKPTTKFKNHAKLNGIYNKIKTASNFNQILKNFTPEGSVAHLIFDIGKTERPDAQAETREPENYWIKITFNQNKNWANIPKVVISGTFMHEIIHAEMLRQLLTVANSNGNLSVDVLKDYVKNHKNVELFNAYIKSKTDNSDYQHELMAKKYVTTMVNFLKQVYGNQYADTEYETVVWMSSIMGTKAWFLLPQTKRTLYTKTWNENYGLWEL